MKTRKMNRAYFNRAYFDARIARVNNLMGVEYKIEYDSTYAAWKVIAGSRFVGYCNTHKEFDAFISGMIEASQYFNPGQ